MKLPAVGCWTATATLVAATAVVAAKLVMATALAALPLSECHMNDGSEYFFHGMCCFVVWANDQALAREGRR